MWKRSKKRVFCLLMTVVLFASGVETISMAADENVSNQVESIENNSEIINLESSEEESNAVEDDGNKDEAEENTVVEGRGAGESGTEKQEDHAEVVSQSLVNYLGVDKPYLSSPDEQKVAISFGKGNEDIASAYIICKKEDGTSIQLDLSLREENVFLFNRTFLPEEKGTYVVESFTYVREQQENTIILSEIGIEAMFGVDEEYPGYTASQDAQITSEKIEMSVVNVETGEVTETKDDIAEAIEATEDTIENKQTNGASVLGRSLYSTKEKNKVVVLDPGHGGAEYGACENGLVEKNLNLKIAQYCKAELEEYVGVTVYMTRTTDTNVGIKERAEKAKSWGADVLVSIHINSYTDSVANGVEVYYPNNNYNSAIGNQGEALADSIQKELVKLGLNDRGIKVRNTVNDKYPDGSLHDYYGVIRHSKLNGFPGIIVEHAFISNPSDAVKLKSEAFLKQLGVADAAGIAKYFNLSKVKNPMVSIENKDDFDGTCDINVAGVGEGAQVAVWSEAGGQDDLRWYSVSGSTGIINWNKQEHKNSSGVYNVHVYNSSGNKILCETTFRVSGDTSTLLNVSEDEIEKKYTLELSFADMPDEVEKVSFAIWSSVNQQDLKWHDAKQTQSGKWIYVFDVSDYAKAGEYSIHSYVTLKNGAKRFLQASCINIHEPVLSVKTENYKREKGTFDVVIENVSSPSGISKIDIPVWCLPNQSDINWYRAEKQDNGSYKATVNIANHNYNLGTYEVHTYITAKNGIYVFGGKTQQKVEKSDFSVSVSNEKSRDKTFELNVNGGIMGPERNVQFAVWSVTGGQDDLIWYNGKKNANGVWNTQVDINRHKTPGTYNVHVYATMLSGGMYFLGTTSFKVEEPTLSVRTGDYNKNRGTFDVIIDNVVSPSGISKIDVPVWCSSDQSDIKWYRAEKQNDGTYRATVNISNHNYHPGTYIIHTYITAGNEIFTFGGETQKKIELSEFSISVANDNANEKTYALNVSNSGMIGTETNLQFAVWSVSGGQDDLVWYNGRKNVNGGWDAKVDISKHKTSGTYNVHVYAIMLNGGMRFLGTTSFEVKRPSLSVKAENYNKDKGTFEVIIENVLSPSGITKIDVPVWCSSDQSDIYWYTAAKQDDGTYKVTVDISNHKYHSGTYLIHTYIAAGNGIYVFGDETTREVEAWEKYPIMGNSTVTVNQMVSYYSESGQAYPSSVLGRGGASSITQFCQIYLEEAAAEGVRAEVAFAQAMNETGWLQYGGIVKVDQYNFAGIGALDGNATGQCASFPDVRTGIRAQIQHLKAYGSEETLRQACVDPRFHLVKRGSAVYVQWLGIQENPKGYGWATSKNYGFNIIAMINDMKQF